MLYTQLLCQLYVYVPQISSPRDRDLWFNDSFSHFTVYSDLKRIPLLGLEFIFCEVLGSYSLGKASLSIPSARYMFNKHIFEQQDKTVCLATACHLDKLLAVLARLITQSRLIT